MRSLYWLIRGLLIVLGLPFIALLYAKDQLDRLRGL